MASSMLVLVLGAAFIAGINAQKCPGHSALAAVGCQVEDNGQMVSYTGTDISYCQSLDGCCWNGNGCVNKDSGIGKPVPVEENPFVMPSDDGAKSLAILQPQLTFCKQQRKPFPSECKFSRNEPYVTSPPVDVPYCVRIPCSLDRIEQKALDKSHFQCGSQPGCYFDVELFEYREAFGPAVLAGVPVCHMAIRRSVFHREAQKVVSNLGAWNPYYTNCLLKTFNDEIRKEPAGCKLVNMLKVFKIQPKLAGWEGITSNECVLIDGCWRQTDGCVYPVDVDNIIVKSNQRFRFNRFEVTYGRPKCQHFNSDTPYEMLKSYHQCLASGCSVDASVASLYYNNLYEIGNQMTPSDHWEYWRQVEGGKIGSSNIEEGVYWDFDRTFGKGSKPIVRTPPKPDPSNPFALPPSSGGGSNLFGIPGMGSPGVPSGVQLSPPAAQDNKRCGAPFKRYGYRPCAPPTPPTFVKSDYCPYKPFVVPRFKPLKGSFRGCCKVNPCYLSRRDIRKMHSGPSFYYTEWSLFSSCSKTCGPGVQKRYRRCVTHDKALCRDKTVEERPCQDQMCGRWGSWSKYPICEYKFQLVTRTRHCEPRGAKCGKNQETEEEEVKYCDRAGQIF